MTVLGEPIPIPPTAVNAQFFYNEQISSLSQQMRNISLTQRDGDIENNDKTGNISGVYVTFTSNGTANTEDAVAHKLGRRPVGYIPVKQNKAAVLYDSGTTSTTTTIYWKSSVVSVTWTVMVF